MPVFALVAMVLLLAGCGDDSWRSAGQGSGRDAPSAHAVLLSEESSGQEVRLRPGQTFGISVRDNASIGNIWSVDAVPSFLEKQGFRYTESSDREGDDTSKTFSFEAGSKGRGEVRLVLNYRGEPQRELVFPIVVE